MSSDRLFQALMVDGSKELKKSLVRARIDWMLSELLYVSCNDCYRRQMGVLEQDHLRFYRKVQVYV